MMTMKILCFHLVLIFMVGCVGTVTDGVQKAATSDQAIRSKLTFAGASKIEAISDTRVEIYFPLAQGGSGAYIFEIFVDHLLEPIVLTSDVLGTPDSRGNFRYVLKDLERLKTYNIKIDVKDQFEAAEFIDGEVVSVTTYPFEVGRFDGIINVSNVPGESGKDSLRIRFVPAETSGALVLQPWDPVTYELVVIDVSRLSVTDMDVAGLDAEDGLWKYTFNSGSVINEYVARGLPADTEFDLRLRVLHENSVNDFFDPRRRGERNNRYIRSRTLSDQLSSINFNTSSFEVRLQDGNLGLSSLEATWDAASGVFDHYRIYFSRPNVALDVSTLPSLCLPPLLTLPTENTFCRKVDSQLSSAYISGLQAYSDYSMVLVLCQNSSCTPGNRIISDLRTIRTDPSTAQFSGITSIDSSGLLEEIDTIRINFNIPNFQNGYFDGLVLMMRRSIDDTATAVRITTTSSSIYHESYDFLLENSISVRGIDRTSTEPYCFSLYPFKETGVAAVIDEFPSGVWRCYIATIETPKVEEFIGLTNASMIPGGYVNLLWELPTAGIFSHYEIFVRSTPGDFSFAEAIAQTSVNNYTNYRRVVLGYELGLSTTLNSFDNGSYKFGVITMFYYLSSGNFSLLRSEYNNNIFQCDIDVAADEPPPCTKI